MEVETLFIEPGRTWENGYIESFNGTLRDRKISDTLMEVNVLIEPSRVEYNTIRQRRSLGHHGWEQITCRS